MDDARLRELIADLEAWIEKARALLPQPPAPGYQYHMPASAPWAPRVCATCAGAWARGETPVCNCVLNIPHIT